MSSSPPSSHCHGAGLLTIERKGWVILDINKKMATINSTKDEHKIKEKQEKKEKDKSDCEQSFFFFKFSKGSARAREW